MVDSGANASASSLGMRSGGEFGVGCGPETAESEEPPPVGVIRGEGMDVARRLPARAVSNKRGWHETCEGARASKELRIGAGGELGVLDERSSAGLSEEFEGDATSRVGDERSSVRVAREVSAVFKDGKESCGPVFQAGEKSTFRCVVMVSVGARRFRMIVDTRAERSGIRTKFAEQLHRSPSTRGSVARGCRGEGGVGSGGERVGRDGVLWSDRRFASRFAFRPRGEWSW